MRGGEAEKGVGGGRAHTWLICNQGGVRRKQGEGIGHKMGVAQNGCGSVSGRVVTAG